MSKAEKFRVARAHMAVVDAAKDICPLWDAFEVEHPGVTPSLEGFARWFERNPRRVIALLKAAGLLPNVVVWSFGDMEGAIRVPNEEAYPELVSQEMPEEGPFKVAHMRLPARYEALDLCLTMAQYPAVRKEAERALAKATKAYYGPTGAPVKA